MTPDSRYEAKLPIIDIAPLMARDARGEVAVARAIGAACREIGFSYITGHGIPATAIERVLSAAGSFFAAPASIKAGAALA